MHTLPGHNADRIAGYRQSTAQDRMPGVTDLRRMCSVCRESRPILGGRTRPRFVCARCQEARATATTTPTQEARREHP